MTNKILVTGTYRVEPNDRDAFIEATKHRMHTSRAEDGCEEFVLAADPIDPSRVIMTQQWRDRAALDTHIAAETGAGARPKPTSVSIEFHTIASTQKVV